MPLLTSRGFFATPLLPQERPDITLLFLEPGAFLAPGPRPAAGRVLVSAVSSKGQPPLSMLGSPIHFMYLLAPGGLGRHTLPGGTVGGGWERPTHMPSVSPSLLTVSQLGCFQKKHMDTFRADPRRILGHLLRGGPLASPPQQPASGMQLLRVQGAWVCMTQPHPQGPRSVFRYPGRMF